MSRTPRPNNTSLPCPNHLRVHLTPTLRFCPWCGTTFGEVLNLRIRASALRKVDNDRHYAGVVVVAGYIEAA